MLSQKLSTSRLISSISCHSDKPCQKRLKAPGSQKVQFPMAGKAWWLESLQCALFISWWIRKLTSCYRTPQGLPLVADLSLAAKSHVQRTSYPLKKELPAGDQVFSPIQMVSALRTSVPLSFLSGSRTGEFCLEKFCLIFGSSPLVPQIYGFQFL